MPEVSDIWIKLNYWFLNNRKDLKRWWVMMLLGLDLFLIVYVVFNGVITAVTYRKTNALIEQIGTSRVLGEEVFARSNPQDIAVENVTSIERGDGQFLHVVTLGNPNRTWTAAQYFFTIEGPEGSTTEKEAFIPPNENQILLVTGSTGGQGQVVGTRTSWMRTPPETLPHVPIEFGAGIHRYITAQSPTSPRLVSQVTTTVTNASLYDIGVFKGIVVAKNGAAIVGAQQFFVENLDSRESRELSIVFLDALPSFTSIEFHSEVDILDSTNLRI